jgi:hypothetical protein
VEKLRLFLSNQGTFDLTYLVPCCVSVKSSKFSKIQREFLRLQEPPVILGVTGTSVKISLKEELDKYSGAQLVKFFNYAKLKIMKVKFSKKLLFQTM